MDEGESYDQVDEQLGFNQSNQSNSDPNIHQNQTVIFDIGTHACKAGFSSCNFPDAVIPSLIGIPKQSDNQSQNTDIYLGTEAYKMCPTLDLRYPIEYGIVVDWNEFEELFNFMMYNALEFEDISNASVIFTEPVFNPKDNKLKHAELAFERFGIERMMLISQAYCALISEGKTTGLVIDSGESSTSVVPIFDSRIINTAISRFEIGGRTLNDYLIRMLKHKLAFLTSFEKEIARFIKEETCYIQSEMGFMDDRVVPALNYKLPDNSTIKIQETQYMCPELLFDATLIGRESGSIQETITNSFRKTDHEISQILAQN